VYPRRSPVMTKNRLVVFGGPVNRIDVTPLAKVDVINVVKGPTGIAEAVNAPGIVIFGELIARLLLSSTKLPPSAHSGTQAAPPKRANMVAATSSVMTSAFAAPTLRAIAHEATVAQR
jgi:hypothetical protein